MINTENLYIMSIISESKGFYFPFLFSRKYYHIILGLRNWVFQCLIFNQESFMNVNVDHYQLFVPSEIPNALLPKRINKRDRLSLKAYYFTRAQFLASHVHSQRVHSAAASPLLTAFYTKEWEG